MLGVQRPLIGGSGDTKLGIRLLPWKQVCHRLLQGYTDIGCVGSRGASQDCGFSGTLALSAQGAHLHTWGCFKCITRVQILSQPFASLQPQAMYLLPFVCFYLSVGTSIGPGSQHCCENECWGLVQAIHSAWRLLHVEAAGIFSFVISSQMPLLDQC